MGFLLLQYEFQRANREVNLCNRKSIRIDNQLTRATKRIEKMESVFSKAKSSLDSDWSNKKSAISQGLSNMALGLASASNGNAATAINAFNSQMMNIVIGGVALGTLVRINSIDTSAAGNDSAKAAQIIQTQISQAIGQAQTIVGQLVDQAKAIDEAALEQKQDAQLAPLSDKESDIQAEKSLNDTLTTLWEERKENAKGKLPDAIKDSMSGFGLK